eukprot:364410-Chlamydomonas_euryale.AAC.3
MSRRRITGSSHFIRARAALAAKCYAHRQQCIEVVLHYDCRVAPFMCEGVYTCRPAVGGEVWGGAWQGEQESGVGSEKG